MAQPRASFRSFRSRHHVSRNRIPVERCAPSSSSPVSVYAPCRLRERLPQSSRARSAASHPRSVRLTDRVPVAVKADRHPALAPHEVKGGHVVYAVADVYHVFHRNSAFCDDITHCLRLTLSPDGQDRLDPSPRQHGRKDGEKKVFRDQDGPGRGVVETAASSQEIGGSSRNLRK